MRETLYTRECETRSIEERQRYRETLKELYIRILKFQARTIVYFSKNDIFRLGLDILKWDDWTTMANDITKQEETFEKLYRIWKDMEAQDALGGLLKRHQEAMDINKAICSSPPNIHPNSY